MPQFVRRKAADDRFEIATESGIVEVDLRRHPRARNFTLRVAGPARAPVLTMPKRGSIHDAQQFLERHSGWLTRQLARLPRANPIVEGGEVPVRGVPHVIRHAGQRRGTAVQRLEGQRPELVVAGDPVHLRRRVVDFMKREARRDLEAAVERHGRLLEVRPTAIRLRDQTSRWGSCSAAGQLSFSWRLIMAPPFVLNYLAAHEVAHLRELNHSRRFWHLVEAICPDQEPARAWLATRGVTLHAVGADD
ncbi:MAG: M48 family metallopeptidase [Alphaproteobacteria bacterium]